MRAALKSQTESAREIFLLFGATFRELFRTPWRWHDIFSQIVAIGVNSLPIIIVATAFAGLVMTNEIAWHMDQALHTVQMIPGFTSQFILRELGISIPALLLVSKVGASITAEVGTMKITDQIDALKLLGIQPMRYLVFPRFIACIVANTCLTLLASAVTLFFAMWIAVARYNFSFLEYLNAAGHFLTYKDITCALVKGSIFGGVVPIISCGYGFTCQGGAQGVGSATTNSVVTSTITVIFLDFILTFLFTQVF